MNEHARGSDGGVAGEVDPGERPLLGEPSAAGGHVWDGDDGDGIRAAGILEFIEPSQRRGDRADGPRSTPPDRQLIAPSQKHHIAVVSPVLAECSLGAHDVTLKQLGQEAHDLLDGRARVVIGIRVSHVAHIR